MMGFEFDENGNFLEWSPLFDNSTKETFLASMLIPTPKGKVIQTVKPGEIYDVDINPRIITPAAAVPNPNVPVVINVPIWKMQSETRYARIVW